MNDTTKEGGRMVSEDQLAEIAATNIKIAEMAEELSENLKAIEAFFPTREEISAMFPTAPGFGKVVKLGELEYLRGAKDATDADGWSDRPDDLTDAIKADFASPGFYARYGRAMVMVSNRHRKAALVALVAYLLKDNTDASGSGDTKGD